ncbi:hypothetical protein ABK040_009325 [Willaertia magna]
MSFINHLLNSMDEQLQQPPSEYEELSQFLQDHQHAFRRESFEQRQQTQQQPDNNQQTIPSTFNNQQQQLIINPIIYNLFSLFIITLYLQYITPEIQNYSFLERCFKIHEPIIKTLTLKRTLNEYLNFYDNHSHFYLFTIPFFSYLTLYITNHFQSIIKTIIIIFLFRSDDYILYCILKRGYYFNDFIGKVAFIYLLLNVLFGLIFNLFYLIKFKSIFINIQNVPNIYQSYTWHPMERIRKLILILFYGNNNFNLFDNNNRNNNIPVLTLIFSVPSVHSILERNLNGMNKFQLLNYKDILENEMEKVDLHLEKYNERILSNNSSRIAMLDNNVEDNLMSEMCVICQTNTLPTYRCIPCCHICICEECISSCSTSLNTTSSDIITQEDYEDSFVNKFTEGEEFFELETKRLPNSEFQNCPICRQFIEYFEYYKSRKNYCKPFNYNNNRSIDRYHQIGYELGKKEEYKLIQLLKKNLNLRRKCHYLPSTLFEEDE